MNEKLLQYIWQFRYYNQSELFLETGERLQVIFPGHFNQNQGPDFLSAKIRIGQTTWVGHIELHLKTSDWYKHVHNEDRNYNNVILHVVMENDLDPRKESVPVLALHQRISRILQDKCEEWMQSQAFIPCAENIGQANALVWASWMERLVMERMIRKSGEISLILKENNFHWEEVFWWRIAGNFGTRVNGMAFEAIARSLSVSLLARHKSRIHQLEALLMGQAGFLEKKFKDVYPNMLKKEFQFLKNKYRLEPIFQPIHFLRMRPVNFPTIRLSQLAALIFRSSHLFSVIRETRDLEELKLLLNVNADEYWNRHYRFDEESGFMIKSLGGQMLDNLLINTIVPLLFCYGWIHQEMPIQERALEWLRQIPYEKNAITEKWKNIGVSMVNAFQSQSLLELKTKYCDDKKCLACSIGNALLKKLV